MIIFVRKVLGTFSSRSVPPLLSLYLGMGSALLFTPPYIIVGQYFDKKKGIAMSLGTVGAGLFLIFFFIKVFSMLRINLKTSAAWCYLEIWNTITYFIFLQSMILWRMITFQVNVAKVIDRHTCILEDELIKSKNICI